MKMLKYLTLLILPLLTIAEEADKNDPNKQKAIKSVSSNICHAELIGGNFQSMQDKVDGTDYIQYGTLTECIASGGRLDKRYAQRFSELSLLETQLLTKEKEDEFLAIARKDTSTQSEINAAKNSFEFAKQLEKTQEKELQDINDFYGFNWAPGIAVMSYNSSYISDVRIETTGEGDSQTNTVYIDKEVDTNIAIMLETHYLWELPSIIDNRSTGIGILVATNLMKQEGDPLTVFAIGPIFSVKNKDSSNGLSIGLAFFIDTDFKELRDDLVDGSETSFTDSSKIIRTVDESGLMLMVSAKF